MQTGADLNVTNLRKAPPVHYITQQDLFLFLILSLFLPIWLPITPLFLQLPPPPHAILDPPHTPCPWRPQRDLAICRMTRLLQAASSSLIAIT